MADYETENFGILTDDDLYLDCLLLRSPGLADERLRSIRVWVPRYPLTKTSVLACARHEASSAKQSSMTAHLVFDLRGTGESEGMAGDIDFQMDLRGIRSWAQERFGRINLTFLGQPVGSGEPNLFPLRPAVTIEYYHIPPGQVPDSPKPGHRSPSIIYLSGYGNFTEADDGLVAALANEGFEVFGLDAMRYLLHASSINRVDPPILWADLAAFCQAMKIEPIIVGRPLAAGLALLWTSKVDACRGVISIGRAQDGFSYNHIFNNDNLHTFFLGRHVQNISPKPVAVTLVENQPLGGEIDEAEAIIAACGEPRRYDKVDELSTQYLRKVLHWILDNSPG